MSDRDEILLQTKLHRPRLPQNLVVRTRLLEVLDHATDHQLTLVCAPAGFGKTTLVSTWLERMSADQPAAAAPIPAAWLSLDENDSDLNLFLRYFIAALRTNFTEACEQTLALLQAQQKPPETVLYATFSNELEELPGEAILVLDDYHTIQEVEVHNLLIEMARHWPKPLHLERDVNQYDYKLLGEDTIDGARAWRIESRPRKKSQYSSSLVWIRQENYVPARIENFVGDRLVRRLNYRRVENIQGIWSARELDMEDLRRSSHTVLRLKEVRYNVPLGEGDFTVQALRREQ